MAFDTKPNLNNQKFEQYSGDSLNLSGNTYVYGDIQYSGSGPTTPTSRSLADRAFVTGLTSQAIVTATNGLNKIGSEVKLGGTISGATVLTLSGDSNYFYLQDTSGGNSFSMANTPSGGSITIQSQNNNNLEYIDFIFDLANNNGVKFFDSRNLGNRSGIEYAGNYAANFTNRSLVDKGYVISQISGTTGGTNASNGLTKIGNTIILGGALTGGTTTIYGYPSALQLGSSALPLGGLEGHVSGATVIIFDLINGDNESNLQLQENTVVLTTTNNSTFNNSGLYFTQTNLSLNSSNVSVGDGILNLYPYQSLLQVSNTGSTILNQVDITQSHVASYYSNTLSSIAGKLELNDTHTFIDYQNTGTGYEGSLNMTDGEIRLSCNFGGAPPIIELDADVPNGGIIHLYGANITADTNTFRVQPTTGLKNIDLVTDTGELSLVSGGILRLTSTLGNGIVISDQTAGEIDIVTDGLIYVSSNGGGITLTDTNSGEILIDQSGGGNIRIEPTGGGNININTSDPASTINITDNGNGGSFTLDMQSNTSQVNIYNSGTGGNSINIGSNGGDSAVNIQAGGGVNINDGGNGNDIIIESQGGGNVQLGVTDPIGNTQLYTTSVILFLGSDTLNSTTFTDNRTGANQSGLEYSADYSANYTSRSLVDKGYVQGLIMSGTSGTTKSSFSITGSTGGTTTFTLTHNKNTRDVIVQVYQNFSPYGTVIVDVQRTTVNAVDVVFGVAPITGENYRVVII